ncbi:MULTISPECIES: hypothetical protein [Paraburkholderia]|uniref:Uncharacterized protein n=1 Tax=Paraburkholderia dioscoreae TaxID=2604047 RepID=A0A5Q4YV24_9BURK|nr:MULTISPECIES: hypothetical protein [Paraburkholderia]MDR8397939.1 hypothetical protein [Paraburkholderia sp. USG1]VVD27972.1 protein of unknown function [Paraburkholderia dioscoreae]
MGLIGCVLVFALLFAFVAGFAEPVEFAELFELEEVEELETLAELAPLPPDPPPQAAIEPVAAIATAAPIHRRASRPAHWTLKARRARAAR